MSVAVKTISAVQLMLNPTALSEMQQEMMLMRTLRHPNIVLFLGGGSLIENQVRKSVNHDIDKKRLSLGDQL